MRNELTYIQLIEKYLMNKLSDTDKMEFEARLKTDNQLKLDVDKQKLVMEGVKRMGLKASAQKGFKKFKTMKTLKYIGITIAVLGAAAMVAYAMNSKEVKTLSPEEILPEQGFVIDNSQDTVIETENGMVLVIPENAFVDENGNLVSNVNFEVKEAFENADILKAGLTTLSDGKLLETGGMFFLNAYSNGKKLQLADGKKILAEIPNINPREDMMLFDGETLEDGSINWVNPKPFEKDLITYDITTLDFYPEGYLEELKYETIQLDAVGELPRRKSNINTNDKQFTDSLYYSFARLFEKEKEVRETEERLSSKSYIIGYGNGIPDTSFIYVDSIAEIADIGPETVEATMNCTPNGINPARIKAIWNKKFNKTILATKEFEARLRVIHQAHNDALLNVYVSNIDKPLWYCDSVASTMAGGYKTQFEAFYKQKKGGVKVSDRLASKLSGYYERKQKAYTEKSSQVYQDFEAKKQKLVSEFQGKKTEKGKEEFNRKMKTYNEELEVNMDEAYRQLDKKRNKGGRIVGSPLRIEITNLGPKNVDAYVRESTKNRTTLDYTDPETGKKAVIKYEEATVKVLNKEKFDRVFVYMIPDSLSSFNRMKTTDNINFKNTLNELFAYKMVCLAYKGEQAYFYESNLSPKHYDVILTEISEGDLKRKLNKSKSSTKNDIVTDVDFYKEEVAFNRSQNKIKAAEELTAKVGMFLFPSLSKWCFESRGEEPMNYPRVVPSKLPVQ